MMMMMMDDADGGDDGDDDGGVDDDNNDDDGVDGGVDDDDDDDDDNDDDEIDVRQQFSRSTTAPLQRVLFQVAAFALQYCSCYVCSMFCPRQALPTRPVRGGGRTVEQGKQRLHLHCF